MVAYRSCSRQVDAEYLQSARSHGEYLQQRQRYRAIKAHLDYISRNCLAELEREDGEIILGREAAPLGDEAWELRNHLIPDTLDD